MSPNLSRISTLINSFTLFMLPISMVDVFIFIPVYITNIYVESVDLHDDLQEHTVLRHIIISMAVASVVIGLVAVVVAVAMAVAVAVGMVVAVALPVVTLVAVAVAMAVAIVVVLLLAVIVAVA